MASGVSREQWRKTALAAMANYIDAGSIVAGAVALPLWAEQFGFGDDFVSLLGAMSSNAISAGIGALIGGRICDLFGRKKIYQYDLLLYAFGALWIVFAQAPWMLLFGYFIVGLTVGADVPASWTLITETAPAKIRGRLAGLAQVLWYVGAIAPLLIGIVLLDLGDVAAADPVRAAGRGRDDHLGAAAGDGRVAGLEGRAEQGRPGRRRVQGALPAHAGAGVPDRHVRRLEPRRRHVRLLLPVHPRGRRQHERPRELHAAGDLVPVDGARRRDDLHAADRPRQRAPDAALGERPAGRSASSRSCCSR